ncbi:hypothetical protein ILYODFUR_025003 [Ilyodon furcidens]|uniref:Uncharacterized protein n=1 Tax=Ilyodon furcidens TaxID=33524 RepID=A0ABV0TAX1_9TELE
MQALKMTQTNHKKKYFIKLAIKKEIVFLKLVVKKATFVCYYWHIKELFKQKLKICHSTSNSDVFSVNLNSNTALVVTNTKHANRPPGDFGPYGRQTVCSVTVAPVFHNDLSEKATGPVSPCCPCEKSVCLTRKKQKR